MPNTFEALAIFAAAIAPGYGFLSGFQRQSSYTSPERDLYALAQAFIFSSIWIALTWWPLGRWLIKWASERDLGEHELAAWAMACAFLGLPYVTGRLLGFGIRFAQNRKGGRLYGGLRTLGVFEPPTLWDWIWSRARDRGSVILVIRLKDGETLEGQFAANSKVDFSPRQPRIFLEKAYARDQEGRRIFYPQGAYVEGDEIVGVQFKT
jgi:hypothetical protein